MTQVRDLAARIEALIRALDAETAAVTDGRLDGLSDSAREKEALAAALDATVGGLAAEVPPDPDLVARLQVQLDRAIARNAAALDAARAGVGRARAQVEATRDSMARIGAYGPDGSSVAQVHRGGAARRA